MNKVFFVEVDEGEIIIIRRIVIDKCHNIIIEDKKTEGLKISFSVKENYSKKNILKFLNTKYKIIKFL